MQLRRVSLNFSLARPRRRGDVVWSGGAQIDPPMLKGRLGAELTAGQRRRS